MNKISVKISTHEPIKVTAKEAVIVKVASDGGQNNLKLEKKLAETLNELKTVQGNLALKQAELETAQAETENTKSELNAIKLELESSLQVQDELRSEVHNRQLQLADISDSIDAAKSAITSALQDKGVTSSGELSGFADDIRQIQALTSIEPNDFFKIATAEEMLVFDLVNGYYTDRNGGNIPYASWSITSYIDVEGAEYVSVQNGSLYSCYYDEDKKPLGSMKMLTYDTVPENAKYLRISNETNALKNLKVKSGRFVIVKR